MSTPQPDLQTQYNNYKNTLQNIAAKIGDLETESDEHTLVIQTLEPLPESRTCYRMINGTLAKQTVKDVLPTLKTNKEGLTSVMDTLLKQYKTTEDQFNKFQKDNKIKVVRQ
ncbi:Prefoldin beta-like protein [Protomyces lactucae-debilis]|uniref:Prefoldin beta-like protein n=1 Tax=Protomyces lactucae-debilis TaxID=2754530 RepID=A0A1Y2FGY5_PROLT|nr:Prefoldin beta-like protein [Protomyces lactucae-debilis]ORY82664.1 Prefoldin beta-like protein [Protomyces lactucae-debilis]